MPITSRIKAGAVAALAGAALSGLALPAQAQAATANVAGAYIRACNYGKSALSSIHMEGKGVDGKNKWVSARTDAYDCATMGWWQVGQTLKVTLNWGDGGVTYRKCSIPSDADGSTLYCKYYYS